MGKIKKILENELIGGTQSTDVYPVTSVKAVYDENNNRLDNIIKELDNKVSTQLPAIEEAKNKALNNIKKNEQSAITNFNSQRVIPEMLSESTKQLIEASGGGTITNLADDEDITSVDDGTGSNVLKFKDKAYNPLTYSGMGRKILRKNIVAGKNVLTQNMINESNVTYEIKYDFDLDGQKIIIPKNSTLKFVGGSFSNGTIACADVSICVDNKYPIFIDVVIAYITNASINGIGYEWMTKDTKRTDDYLSLLNMLQFREAIIEEKTVLNIESWVNPYKEQHGVNCIRTSTICLDGRGCVINILCDDYSEERPISKTQTDYRWGINLDPYSFIDFRQFADRRGEQKLVIKNLRIIDDKAINGKGADLTNPYISYNDQIDRNNRGTFIGVNFSQDNEVQGLEMIFDNIYFRSRQGFISSNLAVGDKINIPNVLFNNCELYTLCNFTNELWGIYGSINTLYFMNCILNTYNGTMTSSGTPKYIIYKNCTFISDCLCQAGVTENSQAKVIYENCRFVNAGPVFTPDFYADIEVYNSLFYTKNINGHYGNFKGMFWDFSVNGNILYDNCKFNLYSVSKRFIGTEANCIIKNSEIIINDSGINYSSTPLHSLIIVNTKFFNYMQSASVKRTNSLPQATNNRILDVSFNDSTPYNKHNNDIKSFTRSTDYPVDVTLFAYDSEIIYPYNSKQDGDIFKGNILYKCSQRDFNFIHKYPNIVFNTDFSIDVMIESYVLKAISNTHTLITFNIGTISFQIIIVNKACQFKINTWKLTLPLQRGLHNYSITFHKYKHDGYLEDKGNVNYNTVISMIDGEIVSDNNTVGSLPDIQFENNSVSTCTIKAGGDYGLKGLILKNFATIL